MLFIVVIIKIMCIFDSFTLTPHSNGMNRLKDVTTKKVIVPFVEGYEQEISVS